MAVSDTVLDMVHAIYHDKPLILMLATFKEKLVSHHRAVNTFEFIKAVSDIVLDIFDTNDGYV